MTRIKDGDELARHLLFEKYRLCSWRLAHKLLPTYHSNGLTADELMSCAFLATEIALRSHDDKKGEFYSYWRKIALNEINHYLREYVIKKNELDFTVISLDNDDDSAPLHDIVGKEDESIKNEALLGKIIEIIKDEKTGLKDKEKTTVDYYLQGLSFLEISQKMKCSRDTAYRRFKSAVKKMRQFYLDPK